MDVVIDHGYGTAPSRKRLSRRAGKWALVAFAWGLALISLLLALAGASLVGCSYLECWML